MDVSEIVLSQPVVPTIDYVLVALLSVAGGIIMTEAAWYLAKYFLARPLQSRDQPPTG
jgi:hypothetical protein